MAGVFSHESKRASSLERLADKVGIPVPQNLSARHSFATETMESGKSIVLPTMVSEKSIVLPIADPTTRPFVINVLRWLGLLFFVLGAVGLGLGVGLSQKKTSLPPPVALVEMGFIVDGTVEAFTPAVRLELISKVASELNVTSSDVNLIVASASVSLTFTITMPSASEAALIADSLNTTLSSEQAASAFLTTELLNVNVVSISTSPTVLSNSGHGHSNSGYANTGSRRRLHAVDHLPALDQLAASIDLDELFVPTPRVGAHVLTRETCAASVIPQSLKLDAVDWYTLGEPKGKWLRRYDPDAESRPVCLGRDPEERAKWYEAAFESKCDRPSMVWTDHDSELSRFTSSMQGEASALLGLDPSLLEYCKSIAGDAERAPRPTDAFWRHDNTSKQALHCPSSIGCKDGGPVSLLESNLLDACSRANKNILRVSALYQKQVSWDMCHNTEWVICAAQGKLPHQGPSIEFATPPSRVDANDQDKFRTFRANILRWSANYEIDTISWTFYEFELCTLTLLCDNHEEMWSLAQGQPFQCKVSAEGKQRLRDAFELALA